MSDLPASAPPKNEETKPYWDGTAEGVLRMPRCDECGLVIFYPRSFCPKCRSRNTTWVDLSGRGSVYSYTVTRRMGGRWQKHAPLVIAYVELEEGPRMLTNLVDCDPEAVTIGMLVEVAFDDTGEESAVPRFAPRAQASNNEERP